MLKLFSFFGGLAESPSSSASDVDNLNNQSTAAKAVSARALYSPQIAGNSIPRNNHHLTGLLAYVSVFDIWYQNRKLPIGCVGANAYDKSKSTLVCR